MSNEYVLKRASLLSIECILLQVQLRLADLVARMEDIRMPKAVFFSDFLKRKRDHGALKKRYKNRLK